MVSRTAVAEALGYDVAKEALKQYVCKQRKQKRETLPMTTTMTKCEREAIWISSQGVRDLVEGRSNAECERFWRWLVDTVMPQLHGDSQQELTLNAQPQAPEHATEDAITEEAIASMRWDRQKEMLQYKIMQLRLAEAAHKFSNELGLQLPDTLQPEYLMRAAALQEQEHQPAPTVDEIAQTIWATKQQEEMNLRLLKKVQRLELALEARKLANECGWHVRDSQLLAERQALEIAATPAYLDEDGWLTAGDYLRYARGHSEEEVQQLQTSFGRSLKAHHLQQQGQAPETVARDYHQNEVHTCRYHVSRDRALLNAAYQVFALTDLYRRVVPLAAQAINNL